jgi:hypothetical protein
LVPVSKAEAVDLPKSGFLKDKVDPNQDFER